MSTETQRPLELETLPEMLDRVRPIDWVWYPYVPAGHVTYLAGAGGRGKSVLVSGLELAMVTGRGEFLGAPVRSGPVIHLDADANRDAQGPHYRRVAAGMEIDPSGLHDLRYVALDGEFPESRFAELEGLIDQIRPGLVVFDSFSSCFPYVRSAMAEEVAFIMGHLKRLAARGVAVLVIDHVAKSFNGSDPDSRGPVGSHFKVGGSRSVLMLRAVDGAGVLPSGRPRKVVSLEPYKANLAVHVPTLTVEFESDDLPDPNLTEWVRLTLTDPPDKESELGQMVSWAMNAARERVGALPPGQMIERGELMAHVESLGPSPASAKRAIELLVKAGELIPGKGSDSRRTAYRAGKLASLNHTPQPQPRKRR